MRDCYRVYVGGMPNPTHVSVMYLGMELVDDELSGEYDGLEYLPKWMQSRLATLSMLNYEPPTETIEGVGRRIAKYTYWVQKPDS